MNAAYLAVRILAGASAVVAALLFLVVVVLSNSNSTTEMIVTLLVFCGVIAVLNRVVVEALRPGPPSWLVVGAAAVLPIAATTLLFK
jgi:hypothetical protein